MSDTYFDKPFPRRFGIQECEIDSSLIYQCSVRSIRKSGKEGGEELRRALRSELGRQGGRQYLRRPRRRGRYAAKRNNQWYRALGKG